MTDTAIVRTLYHTNNSLCEEDVKTALDLYMEIYNLRLQMDYLEVPPMNMTIVWDCGIQPRPGHNNCFNFTDHSANTIDIIRETIRRDIRVRFDGFVRNLATYNCSVEPL